VNLSFLRRTAAGREGEPLRFDFTEFAGSLGDLGTYLPLTVAMTVTCGMDLGLIFIFAGLMNLVTGLLFRLPVPVQPMKAIAAVAITEELTPGSIAAAGILSGAVVLALALSGSVEGLARLVPRSVVRGIQASIGISLAWKGIIWVGKLPWVGLDSIPIAILCGGVLLIAGKRRHPVLLYVFLVGFLLVGLKPEGFPIQWELPSHPWGWIGITGSEWWIGLTHGAIPQLPLTLLNSVVAVCALSGDYFPGRGIPPRQMAASVGLMNLVCVPLGGMPMCHGAGGLAAQYRFGARTGGSVVMLGLVKIAAGLLLASYLLPVLQDYPASILAVMVIASGVALAAVAQDSLRGSALVVVLATVIGTLAYNTLIGFLVGCVAAAVIAFLTAE
jgi:MFS superfamily sulfate permease-like transporter